MADVDHHEEHEALAVGGPGPVEDDPVPPETLRVPGEGLDPRPGRRKRVVIVGAGMAGLVAAYELERRGHEPIVLEARRRVGGRIWTSRDFAPGLYAELGAMRIPAAHDLTLAYCRELGLTTRPFLMGNPRGLVHVGGVRMTMADAQQDPGALPFALAEHEAGRTADDLWMEAVADIRRLVEEQGDAAWQQIVADYDQYSLYEFLRLRGFSEAAIEY